MPDQPPAPPPYSVRISARAKRLHLKVLRTGKVEVVAPQGYNLAHIPNFVAQHQEWVTRTLADFAVDDTTTQLPNRIALAALDEHWTVHYPRIDAGTAPHADTSPLLINASNINDARQELLTWLNDRARATLIPWLDQLSRQLGLTYQRATIRAQKTRWGSCSSRLTISLNRNLLFLAPELTRYVLIHELCHTVHLNHSHGYWRLVGSIEPNFRNLDTRLRHGARNVPAWALP